MAHYARSAEVWLGLELPEYHARLESATALRIGEEFRLRLQRDSCLWRLFEFRSGRWRAFQPTKPCLSLVEWLAQIRRRVTLPQV